MKTLLVTGGCGFIASNFINHFIPRNPDTRVINIDAMYYCANENNINTKIRNSPLYTLIKGNLCSKDLVSHILEHFSVNKVIHFAAQSHVDNSFDGALDYTRDNIMATHILLECCRQYGNIDLFIHVSTDEVYGDSMLEEKKTEQSVLCPTNPYAATKAAAELIAKSYYFSFKMPIIITRGNNVYGPNQYPEKLIPKFIKLLNEDKPVTIQGDGSNIRGFVHVTDVVRAFSMIIDKGTIGEIYNIGTDESEEYSVMKIAKILIGKIKGAKSQDDYDKWIKYIKDRPYNDKRYYISNQKVKELGWNLTVSFDQGIDELINVTDHE